jgi:SagB-type dehydrogenase family enzyme
MHSAEQMFRLSELNGANWPELRDHVLSYDLDATTTEGRTYPGYPRWPLDRVRGRWWPALDRALRERRCFRALGSASVPRRTLSRLLGFAHGVQASAQRGPVPSAGGLQALELYVVSWVESWLPAGLYHYDRVGHALAQLAPTVQRVAWRELVPSLDLVQGGALLWIVVGDAARVVKKYAERSHRFLLLEAGHLMQNLCLLSWSLGLATVPLGVFLEPDIARALTLPAGDAVLYVGVCGSAGSATKVA